MAKIFDRYWGSLRRMKLNYVIYNFLQQSKLMHNKALYKKYGIKKPIYFPISSADFAHLPQTRTRFEGKEGLRRMEADPEFQSFSSAVQTALRSWPQGGYVLLPGFFDEKCIDACNSEIDQLMAQGEIDFNYSGKKIMFAYRQGKNLKALAKNAELIKILSFLIGDEALPFQSINFIKGSEQRAHSDFIHMATYPLGHLTAAWVAFEDIGPDQGSLFYYPGSHLLPYILNSDYEHGGSRFMLGREAYLRYEEEVQSQLRVNTFSKVDFEAEKGDVFLWHGNLIHGGNKMNNKKLTRKSMVVHYFTKAALCYHELTQRPALMDVEK